MRALVRIVQNALAELSGAIRSRWALVVLLLYLASTAFCMYGTISILGRMEGELARVLQLPANENTGMVSVELWKSKPFRGMVRAAVADDLVYHDIEGRQSGGTRLRVVRLSLRPSAGGAGLRKSSGN